MPLLPDLATFRKALSPGRLLGFDLGEKTIGLALSDPLRGIASPMETLRRGKFSHDVKIVKQIIDKHSVSGIVMGYPVNMDGSEGPRSQAVRQFVRNMESHVTLPALLWDERLSTMAVERAMLEADLSRQRRAELVDKTAAAYILQGALDALRVACDR